MKMLGIAVAILILSLSIIGYCIGTTCQDRPNENNERTQAISYFEK